ncbi:MAG: histidinol-phosphatase HisJ family protein [Oscillospiraceae bacterium]
MQSYLYDSHTHSLRSVDAHFTVEELAEAAVAAGLAGFALTDHCEGNLWNRIEYGPRLAAAAEDVAKAKEQYAGRLDIALGVEYGRILDTPDITMDTLNRHPYDVVLLSLHQPHGWEDLSEIDYSFHTKRQLEDLVHQYFRELIAAVEWNVTDVIAHLSYPLRPMAAQGVHLELRDFEEPVRILLKAAVERGMAVEVNTKGIRQKSGGIMPPLWVLELFRELGGEYATIGSDAHRPQDIGSGLADGMELARQAGFRHFAVYKNRKPVLHSL